MSTIEPDISFEFGIWFKRIAFAIIAFVLIVTLFELYDHVKINSFNAESEIFIYRTLYSPHGLSYHDLISGRTYPGIIDLDNFKNNSLQTSVNYGTDNLVGAKITLKHLDGTAIESVIYNPQTYERIEERGISGPGGVDTMQKQIYVLINSKGKTMQGIIEYSLVVERS